MLKYICAFLLLISSASAYDWDSGQLLHYSVRYDDRAKCMFIDIQYAESDYVYRRTYRSESMNLTNLDFSTLRHIAKTAHKCNLEAIKWAGVVWRIDG